MNMLAASSPTMTITQPAYHTRNATDMSATPHGTRSRQFRTEPARKSSTLQTHCAHASTVAVHSAEPRLRMGRMIPAIAPMAANPQEEPKNQCQADSTTSTDGTWQEEREMGNIAQPGMSTTNGWWTCVNTKHGECAHKLVSSARSTRPKATSPEGESPGAVADMFQPSQTHWVPDLTSCGDVEPNPGPEQPNTPAAQNSAVAALERTNEKHKEAWKKYVEIRDKVKDKKRPRDDAHDKALTAVKDVLADFSKQATAFQHPLIEKLKEHITEISKQLLQVHEQQEKAQETDPPQLRDQEHFLFEQMGTCLDQVTHLVLYVASPEAAGAIENQSKTIQQQQHSLDNQKNLLGPKSTSQFYKVNSQPTHSASASPPTPSTCNLLSAFAQENVAAVVKARQERSQTAVLDVVSPLCDSEQQQLMLRCHWENFPATLQSHTLMRMEGASKSWKGIGDMQPDQLSSKFPVDHLSILFVKGGPDLPDLMNALVKCKFIPIIRPARLDILVQATAQTEFHLWASKLSESMKWIPDAFIRFNRPLKNTAGHELSFFVIQSSATGIANKLEPEFLNVRLLSEGATLARKPLKAQRPDPNMRVIQVDEKDMPHAMQK